jgi:hypothetical protein
LQACGIVLSGPLAAQFDLQCRFYGPESGKMIVNLHLIAENKGSAIRGIKNIRFLLLGLKAKDELRLYQSRDGAKRLAFPDAKISETLEYTYNVEPGIKQISL